MWRAEAEEKSLRLGAEVINVYKGVFNRRWGCFVLSQPLFCLLRTWHPMKCIWHVCATNSLLYYIAGVYDTWIVWKKIIIFSCLIISSEKAELLLVIIIITEVLVWNYVITLNVLLKTTFIYVLTFIIHTFEMYEDTFLKSFLIVLSTNPCTIF